ncbi:hypothetical protein P175DRAFT_0516966 [Aspergillus ochraceoroseus IBT 24754]|uniref:Dihydroxyacetone kinase n=1 Tax=Aspergillus ochraceoroseus IBT 24754 TaxID=1392256 RepID=A0A2T5LUJ3_9EURO|nr:uncharacterized protein P175DRAFT_0516966 [Aspergillus ochraceoroseus IBT 24754]PTU19923.1 hypothetical protein P175DRAFT_0516966 [Aspergillus ochraceoroseus IBT 24754]
MSSKHYFPSASATSLVPRYLSALVRANPHLDWISSERVIYDPSHDASTVSVISGGGSGHEPSWSGFVGSGLLAAAVCGDIFASPSTKQVLAAVDATRSNAGTIFLITNYTGDKLHFGLAAEKAKANGLGPIAILYGTDDVSIGRSKCETVGRRGMPGHVITMKIVCAAAGKRYSFERCVELGTAVNAALVSIGSALDHCHVPGRQNHERLGDDICAIGAGIHNEPAQMKISPFPAVEDVVNRCLDLLCDSNDAERAFVDFLNKEDEVVLLINNYGGLSNLELGALTDEVLVQLEEKWGILPVRIFSGAFETSLNAPGFSVSLCNLSVASRTINAPVSELLDLLDAPTTAPQRMGVRKSKACRRVDPLLLDRMIRKGCEAAIDAEPKLTHWDMVMGDGDCGEAVKGACEAILRQLDSDIQHRGSIISFLFSAIDAIDDMAPTAATFAAALTRAVEALKAHTSAREGDRTVMDVLLPFTETFTQTGDFHAALQVAKEKAEGTRFLKPKFGRATYVGEDRALPDPGAWALYEILNGMGIGME